MKEGKKGEGSLGISFGVIFSIILIVFFILIAGIVINSFLGSQKCAQVGIFVDNFGSEIEKSWSSPKVNSIFNGKLPSGIEYVCFMDLDKSVKGDFRAIGIELGRYGGGDENMFLYPVESSC